MTSFQASKNNDVQINPKKEEDRYIHTVSVQNYDLNYNLYIKMGDFHVTGALLLTDCIVWNHLWMGGCKNVFLWFMILDKKILVFMEMMYTTI